MNNNTSLGIYYQQQSPPVASAIWKVQGSNSDTGDRWKVKGGGRDEGDWNRTTD